MVKAKDAKPSKQELVVVITYYIGLFGSLISSSVVAISMVSAVVAPDTHIEGNLWIHGLKALIVFSTIMGGAIWWGLKNDIMEIT